MPDASATTYNPLTGISWDTKLSGTSIGVYFYPAGVTVVTIDINDETAVIARQTLPINDYQLGRYTAALALYSDVTPLTFKVMANPELAAIRIMQADLPPTDEEDPGTLGFASPPGTNGTSGLAVLNAEAPSWSTVPGSFLENGGDAFQTLIHELGHDFGLAHPHDAGSQSTIFPGVTSADSGGDYDLNQGIYTMMSYRPGWYDGPANLPGRNSLFGAESTPMAYDVAALQAKYGANTGYRTGDDTYVLPSSNDVGTSYQCIWDAGGTNTIAYSGAGNATIDLRPATLLFAPGGGGYVSSVAGVRGGLTIAHGVTISRGIGGTGDDLISASDADTFLAGNGGNNILRGGAGNDTIMSTGNDMVAAGAGHNLVQVGAGASVFSTGFDTVFAGAGQTLVGTAAGASDLVAGGSGNLVFVGGDTASTVLGGSGAATIYGGGGGGIFAGGRAGGSLLVAGTGATTLFGGGGADILFAQGSNQVLVAGSGNETLSGGHAIGGNVFFAGSGADLIAGGGSSDVFFAGTGQQTVLGGGGTNLFAFSKGQSGQTTIMDFNAAAGDRLTLLGFERGAAAVAFATAHAAGGGSVMTLSDGTMITISGALPGSSVFI